MDWKRVITGIAAELEGRVDRVRLGTERDAPRERPIRVVPYRGFGTPDRVRVRGRVLRGAGPAPATPADRWWVNLANAYRRLETDEVAGAQVRVRFRGAETEVVCDDEGHFTAEVNPADPLPGDRLWHDAHVELVQPAGRGAAATVAVPCRARFGVISDLDDTVLRTDARNLLRMAREVLFGNVHTRIPFPGVGAFYRALHLGADDRRNPFFYVSSSPWNLYDLLVEFLLLHRIPAGPLELRDWGFSGGELLPLGHRDHKRKAIDTILATYPALPFILVGDSGQEDPEIYRDVVHDHPGRILAIYIRSVVPEPLRIESVERLAREVEEAHASDDEHAPSLVLVEDTLGAARHAAERGWIDPDALDALGRQRREES